MTKMLSTLRSIVQELSGINNLQEALDTIAERVQEAMQTEVCSVYLFDRQSGCYVLKATEGLYKEAVGQVRIGSSEGLVGLVGTREEPINLGDAQSHPRNRYFPETGEERFRSFLGVPITHHRRVLGVLVVQESQNQRYFDEGEEAFLVTISAQLAGVIAHSEATGAIGGVSVSGDRASDVAFSGVAGSPGVAIGQGVVVFPPADLDAVPNNSCDDVEAEIERFRHAVASVREDVEQVGERLAPQLRPEEQALFEVYLRMLHDHALPGEVESRIRDGSWAQGALRDVVNQYVRHFEMMGDLYLRERAVDIRDLGRRLLSHLQEGEPGTTSYPDNTILISDELTPAMLGEVPNGKLAGLVSVRGSGNSHVAILARAMGVPTVMGLVDMPITQLNGRELIVDGYEGQIFASPSAEHKAFFESIIDEEQELVRGLEELRDKPCETRDGHRVPLYVNTGLITDVVRSLNHGAEGIGLYRTEVPFMINERFPSEQEQRAYYREQLEAFASADVIMRTLDIGGDKALSYFPIVEENPFLGWRGIRVTLDHPEIFLVQIRAMIKASDGLNNLRIMLPMISNVSEIEEAQHLVYRAWHEVLEEGYDLAMPPVGVMIEIPAAVYQVREIASRVDFISVGSNDLTQYLLAVDRNNPRVASLYHSYHPAVLEALCQIAQDCHDVGKPVSICGELAGDPGGALLLMAMGYDALSMNAANLPKIKSIIRGVDLEMARQLLAEVLTMDSPHVIRSCVELRLRKLGFGRYIRPDRNANQIRRSRLAKVSGDSEASVARH